MKRTVFYLVATVMMLTLGSCGEMVKDSDSTSGRFSLSEIYKEDASSGIRFTSPDSRGEMKSAREMVSDKWNMDFLLASEMRNRLDSLK